MNKEQWEDIKGYEGIYQVSNFGNVKSCDRKIPFPYHGKTRILFRKGIMLKPCMSSLYYAVNLSKKSIQKTTKIHNLVAEAFLPKINGKYEVNHKDCNKLNNHIDNLEWCDRFENMQHASKNKRWRKCERNTK